MKLFTWHSTGHIRCHHQSYREADVYGERLPQGVSTEDGLSDWATAKQLTHREEDNSKFLTYICSIDLNLSSKIKL